MARAGKGDDADLTLPARPDEQATDDEVLALGGRGSPPSWLIALGIGVLVAGVIAIAVVRRAGHHDAGPAPTPLPSGSSLAVPQPIGQGETVDLGQTRAVDLAGTPSTLLVLTSSPPRLGQIDPRTGVLNRQVEAPRGAARLVLDQAGQHAWVTAGRLVLAYDATTLASVGQVRVPRPVFAAAALGDRLYLGTDRGVYVTGQAGAPYLGLPTTTSPVPGFTGGVQTISADPSRHQLIAVSQDNYLLVVRSGGVRVIRKLHGDAPEAIEVTGAGIWAVGFGDAGGTRIGRLNPVTWQITLVDSGDPDAPRAARAWPGQGVFWVNEAYTDSVTCRDARTGKVGGVFSGLDGPVVSSSGLAYGRDGDSVVRLATTASCPG